MKITKLVLFGLTLLISFSCKKKYDSDVIGPKLSTDFSVIQPFTISKKNVDFSKGESVSFQVKFDRPVKWKVSIKGTTSCAERNIVGFSDSIPNNIFWNGAQDSLYYFRNNEQCNVTLSIDKSFRGNYVTDNLENRGDLDSKDIIVSQDTLRITKKKKSPKGQLELFFLYDELSADTRSELFGNSEAEFANFISTSYAGYDRENTKPMEDQDADVPLTSSLNPLTIFKDPNYVPLSCTKGGLRGQYYFMLKGTDKTSMVDIGFPDYYIGRMATPSLRDPDISQYLYGGINLSDTLNRVHKLDASKIYFNVFIYGNADGSTVNYTIKEDENNDGAGNEVDDESYSYSIKIDFLGWKRFSIPYSNFVYTQYKIQPPNPRKGELEDGTFANFKQDPHKILQVQFSLVAPKLGGSGRVIVDNPIISWDGPMKY